MKSKSIIISCLLVLGCFVALPLSAVASNADSEVSIRFSEWADEPGQEPTESAETPAGSGAFDSGKHYPQTGTQLSRSITLLGLLLSGFILFIIFKRRKEKNNEEESR